MNYILFDKNSEYTNLLPLTYTRSIADLRIGILTIKEKWEYFLNKKVSVLTKKHLSHKYNLEINSENIFINSSIIPTVELVNSINSLKIGDVLVNENTIIAYRSENTKIDHEMLNNFNKKYFLKNIIHIKNTWDIFSFNKEELIADFKLITKERESEKISPTNRVLNPSLIFIEKGANVEFSVLNATSAPIYIGKNAEIMENTSIRDGLALCEGSKIKMGSKIYGATTIGPFSTVGGEVKNSVIIGFSNKGHEGFLGNSVLGEWCNLGADTNTSNLKNNYAEVELWNYQSEKFKKTGLQFCGLIMGDHSKTGINTMINTGTVIGVSCNIFGSDFPPNFIPSFSWGGAKAISTYRIEKAIETANLVMKRREKTFSQSDENIFNEIFMLDKKFKS